MPEPSKEPPEKKRLDQACTELCRRVWDQSTCPTPWNASCPTPDASREWIWQYVFPSEQLSADPRSGVTQRHHLDESGLQKAVAFAQLGNRAEANEPLVSASPPLLTAGTTAAVRRGGRGVRQSALRLTPPPTCAKMPRLAVQSGVAARCIPLSARKPSPFRGRWLLATLGVALLCALFLTLGAWQLQRLGQKRAANALILARMQEPPLTLSDQALDPEPANLRRAVVRGTYDYSQEIVLRNRTLNEIPGVHVLVPLRIAGSETAVLVDRGWIPYEMADPVQRAQFRDAVGEVEVSGILQQSQARPGSFAPADPPLGPDRPRLDAWHRVDIPRIQEQVPYTLLPLYLEEAQTADAARSPVRRFPRAAPEIALSEGAHLGYAVQWFAFAGILLGGYTLFFRQRTQGK